MIAKAKSKYVRVSPKKLKLIADEVRGMKVADALAYLGALNKPPKVYFVDVIKSAFSNVRKELNLDQEHLYISYITVENGPRLKRYRSMSMGRAGVIQHRFSHVKIELERTKESFKIAAAETEKTAKELTTNTKK